MLLTWYCRITGALLFILGLAGFLIVAIPNLVQFDLFPSLLYLMAGAIGLQLGFTSAQTKTKARYATITGILGLILLLLGLTFPNLGDIIHLEVPEHVFHLLLGIAGCWAGDYKDK